MQGTNHEIGVDVKVEGEMKKYETRETRRPTEVEIDKMQTRQTSNTIS